MCAQCAIVCIRYMFLAVGVREEQDIRALTADFIQSLPEDIANFLELSALKGDIALKNC